MKTIGLRFLPLLVCLGLVSNSNAHVSLDYPSGGETLVSGDSITIQWQIVIAHNQENWDLYFSPDGGVQWEELQMDLPTSQLSYQWTVPEVVTQEARIRIHMDNTGTDYDDTSGDFAIQLTPLPVRERGTYSTAFVLASNYPNPFNPTTTIPFELPNAANVILTVYDLLGREIAPLVDRPMLKGYQQVIWNGRDRSGNSLPSGIYIARLVTPEYSKSIKMVLLK